ncbi:MAG: hypothetical protein IT456_10665 [Planctomycetes bacterium]|nr:hypothetical protein [Planctomycetota bacterium]
MRPNPKRRGSHVLLDEYFASADGRFVDELLLVDDALKLQGLVERWKVDPRPWALAMQWRYLASPWTTPGHNVVVKRLYKAAERRGDLVMVGAFLHRFDGLVRRNLRRRFHWDAASRIMQPVEEIGRATGGLRGAVLSGGTKNPGRAAANPGDGRQFSLRTRFYLRRRALRVLRHLGFRDPDGYVAAAAAALARYRDQDLDSGLAILDSWCLLQLTFHGHPALDFGIAHANLADGRSLAELTPSPLHPTAWRSESASRELLGLLARAESRLVRTWAMTLLREQHVERLRQMTVDRLLPLFEHDDDEVQAFAAATLAQSSDGGSIDGAGWLRLLSIRSAVTLPTIVAAARLHPAALQTLSLTQRLQLACRDATPVAELGFELVQAHTATELDGDALALLANLRCGSVATAATTWALGLLGLAANYTLARVVAFFDARLPAVRAAAFDWLAQNANARADAGLWARLLESPFDDVRLRLVRELDARAGAPPLHARDLQPLWTSVLLNVHRGGRAKVMALHQLARAAAAEPTDITALLPVFAVAVRSVRPAESRIGLAALVQAVDRVPSLQPAVQAAFPELHFVSTGATA